MTQTTLEWVGPSGDTFTLISPTSTYEVAFLVGDGLEQLVGEFEDEPVLVPGVPGSVFRPRDRQIQPLTGVLQLALVDGDVWTRFRRAFSTLKLGALRLSTAGGVYVLPCRLAEPLASPPLAPRAGTIVPVSVVADGGVWLVPHQSTGQVLVTNYGDVDLAVTVRWQGNGGVVVLPSGHSFPLPPTSEPRVLSLDPRSCHVVTTVDGEPDRGLSAQVRAAGELVPVGKKRGFTVPEGATLWWSVGVLDPWN